MGSIRRKFFKEELRKAFILYALTPIIILSFLFYNLLFWYGEKSVENNNRKYNKAIADIISEEFNNYKLEAEKLVKSPEIKNAISGYYNEAQIYERFYNIVNNHSIRSIFYIFNDRGEVIITNSKTIPQYAQNDDLFMWGVFKRMKDNPEETAMMLNRAQLDVNTRTVYTIGQAVLDSRSNIIGFVVFDILENQLNQIIHSNTSHHVVVTDRYSNNIVATNSALLDSIGKLKPLSKIGNHYVLNNPVLDGRIYINTITSLSFIRNFYLIGQGFLILVFLVLSILMLVIAKRISISKTKSIDELIYGIGRVQEGDLNTILNINSNDEFELLGQYYNEMLVKLNELIEKNKEEVKRGILSEIKHLEAQFNPHFLFNTLEMLKYMIRIDEKSSLKIIVSMSNLLRYSINGNIHKVKLCEDIKYIEDYLTIQKLRFGEDFDYAIAIDQEAGDCMIPKLIIQPIIENSIKYGFETKKYLKVEVSCTVRKDSLVIDIKDNGEGISPEKLSELRNQIYSSEDDMSHIGLHNVQKRVNLLYGIEYGITINSVHNEGTEVIIIIPAHRGEEVI